MCMARAAWFVKVELWDKAAFPSAAAPRHINASIVPATGSRRTYNAPHARAARVPKLRSRFGMVMTSGRGISVPVLEAYVQKSLVLAMNGRGGRGRGKDKDKVAIQE
jgi:hypothetical protein